ncbi:acyltransferase [Leeia oryzae]|uniref:acyltransferase n=1 Tax=Leeia oryzae TaxID=356662 RepID=UPI0003676B72|nr:acyltransferase [Leeia oryzae]
MADNPMTMRQQLVWKLLRLCWRLRQRAASCYWQLLGASLAPQAVIEPGVYLLAPMTVSLAERAILYQGVKVMSTPGGQVSLGRRTHIAPGGYLLVENQRLEIGNQVAIGPHCSIFCVSNQPVADGLMIDAKTGADVVIGNNVFIGAHSVILPGSHLENNVCVAANSVVKGRLASGWLYAGSPARPVKRLDGQKGA